ncbi:uncharacterized protein LOC135396444 [Ornithodoros turicata]
MSSGEAGIARSPSHESFGTDLSLLSLSSLGSELSRLRHATRPTSRLLQVPSECRRRPISGEILLEEESQVIRNCSAFSCGLIKSFSTGDIADNLQAENLRATVSEVGRLDLASRSCSTWVAVGDSQLPSPPAELPSFTADLVCSVNKKVRQMYIRRRLLSTYKALERLTKSELNLTVPQVQITSDELDLSSVGFHGANRTLTLTAVERDRGKPLTKYERNMMIFNWLQNLDENAFDESA